MIHTGPIQGPILPLHRCLPNDTPAEKQRQNVKTALVSGSAAGLPLRCSWVPLVTGKSGWPSRHASRSEHRRAVPRPADVADGLPRQDALAVHAPLISRALRAQLRPEMSLQRGAPAWATSAGALFIIIYIGVSKPLSKFIFCRCTVKNQIVKMHQIENPCVKDYKIVSKIPCAACRAQTLRVQTSPACI